MTNNDFHFIAVDPSLSNSGYAVFGSDQKIVEAGFIKTSSKNTKLERFTNLFDGFKELFKKYPRSILLIESQYMAGGASGATILVVVQVTGLIKATYIANDSLGFSKDILDIAPSSAKKAIGLKGRLKRKEKKPLMMARVKYLYPNFHIPNQDVCDAIAVGVAGMKVYFKDRILNRVKKL